MPKTNTNKIANQVKAAKRLIETCEREIFKGEYGVYTIRGVENLSRSDVDTIIFYCQYWQGHFLLQEHQYMYQDLSALNVFYGVDWQL